ncbi:putative sucrose transporter [Erysiphe necator]|uniref:Putative sucrose transporter n=1 Tax=Uncinula necator TaxID=52586 RepID=A0A0B1PA66_UNCNE|nr:putative sucrose transporter [Erysiphe necator]
MSCVLQIPSLTSNYGFLERSEAKKSEEVSDTFRPTKSKSSLSRGAGVNAQYTLHVWDSQEDSHHPSLQDSHSSPRVSVVFVSTSLSPQHLFSRSPPRLAQGI